MEGTIQIIKKVVVSKNCQIHFTIDHYEGEDMDTQVNIFNAFGNNYLMTIAGNTREEFTNEFLKLIEKYKI